ncbi:MAG: hypothetical protein IV084_06795 [Rugosibacter sp.]|nr:hypothetical protein [Rugosibacter sp.]
MKRTIERSILLVLLVVGLSCAWLGPLDKTASQLVDAGLKRALISFASGRAMNAVLSVVQSADVSLQPMGVGVSLTIGQVVHPIGQLVGQFSELMLAASIAFGLMKFMIVLGGYKGVSLLLSLLALSWAWLCWQNKNRPTWLTKLLLVLVLIRFAVPIVVVSSDVVFKELLKGKYETAQRGINIDENWLYASMGNWIKSPTQIPDRVKAFRQSVESWVGHMVDLIVLFLLQTLVLPLLFLWILYRFLSAMLDAKSQAS